MKKFGIIFIISALAVSCLDEHPKDQLPEEKAYTSSYDLYVNAVATLYNYIGGNADSEGLQGTYRGVYDYNTFTTDEAMLPTRGGDWYDGGFWQNLYLHKWTANDSALQDTWNYLYKVVILCNRSLNIIEEHSDLLSASNLAAYESEVRAIRALFYYELMDMFGRVPLVISVDQDQDSVSQASRSEIFTFLVDELQAVAPYLPDGRSNYEGSCYGRITKSVAYFLLAKLALNAEVYSDDVWTDDTTPDGSEIYFSVDGSTLNSWQTCVAYIDKLEEAGYSLASDYASNFFVHNETSVENIFCIPMDKTLYLNIFKNLFRSRHYNHGSALGMDAENGSCATLSTVAAYGYGIDSVDSRYEINFYSDTVKVDGEVVCLDSGEPLVYRPLEVALDLTGSEYEKTAGARMAKYEIDRSAYSDGQLQDNDIVLFRYADALLMRAEANLRNGLADNAYSDLNAVRSRVGMPAVEATLDNILKERLLELMWEGSRRQDLIRFGKFSEAYDIRPQHDDEATGYTTVFPIPQTVLDLNSSMTQNPKY